MRLEDAVLNRVERARILLVVVAGRRLRLGDRPRLGGGTTTVAARCDPRDGNPRGDAGDTKDGQVENPYDMRYWAMCNAQYWGQLAQIEPNGCVYDDDLAKAGVEPKQTYTLIVTTADQRPSMFTEENDYIANGMVWVQGAADLDNDGRRDLLQMRNLLINPANFEHAVQNVPRTADWRSTYLCMGDYYPAITIECSRKLFEDAAQNGNPADAWEACYALTSESVPPPNVVCTPND